MKFKKDNFMPPLPDGTIEKTLQYEGGATWIFAQRALANTELDCSECRYLEVGPKHGIHTLLIDCHKPKSITCVESPGKLRHNETFLRYNRTWVPHIETEDFEMLYQDFGRFSSKEKYDLLFYCGVLYHNIDQMGHLKKLHDLASEDAYVIFESCTSRNKDLKDKNLIEIHYQPYSDLYRGAVTPIFFPTKLACMSMLEISGWNVLETSDDYSDISNPERVTILCQKGSPMKNPGSASPIEIDSTYE
tara:strand:+ start:392 stop:1132 length:741 start_codon:yes stop_codon:yes gene_type:complete